MTLVGCDYTRGINRWRFSTVLPARSNNDVSRMTVRALSIIRVAVGVIHGQTQAMGVHAGVQDADGSGRVELTWFGGG